MQTLNVTKTAKMLGMSQPAASKVLSQLEHRVGFKLFSNERGRLKPTKEGLNFYTQARYTLNSLEQLDNYIIRARQGKHEQLVISAMPAMCNGVLIKSISEFKKIKPDVNIQLNLASSPDVIDSVVKGQADIGIAMRVERSSQYMMHEVVQHKVAIVPLDHPLSNADIVSCNELAQYDYIYIGVNTGQDVYQDPIFNLFETVPKITYTTSAYSVGCHFVSQGLACAIVDPYTACSNMALGYNVIHLKESIPFNFSIIRTKLNNMNAELLMSHLVSSLELEH